MSNWLERAKHALASGSFLAQARVNCRPNPYRRMFAFEELEPRLTLAAAGLITTPQTYSGTLNGKIVFTSGGHGWQWNDTLNRYATDRGDNNEIVEDFGNQEQMTFYADYALRGGATVVPMRPVGRQINEVVLDNDSVGVTFTGTWSNSGSTRYYDEDYGASADAIPYRYASTNADAETATATYTPNIPQAGFYPVYTWVLRGTDRIVQTYRVNHTGGSTEIKVDHSKVGSGWVYLGTYHFNAGTSATGEGSVQISNKGQTNGPPNSKVVIADAIRFGNGMGDWVDTPTGAPGISGYPREDENSFHWIARSVGVGTTLTTATGASSNNNVSAPSNFAQYMYDPAGGAFGGAVYVGFHSNAGGGRGARGLIDSSAPTPHQAGTNGLADILGDQINQDMQNLNGVFEYNWTTGTTSTYTSGFGEINLGASAEMDATIIEVAFHDSVEDAAIMRDPKGRDQIARSTYQGTLQYFSLYGSPLATNTSLPTPPTTVRVVSNASGAVTLNWAAGISTPASVHGAAATGYKVYTSVDGYGFDGGRSVAGVGTTTLTITDLDPTIPYYFKVAATNAGGESGASEVVVALPSGGAKQVLIVNGFDRFDRTQNFRYDYLGGLVDRVWPRYNNSFDYINRVERAIQAAKPGIHVASTSNEAVISGAVNLTDYDVVVWYVGNESTSAASPPGSTSRLPLDATEQTKITQFLAAGGNLFLSGSEIAWDLDNNNNGRSFFENTLKGNYVADDAATYTATVVGSPGIFSSLSSFAFSSGASSTVYSTRDDQVYNVATPDVIAPQSGAATSLTYSTNAAGIQVGTGGIGTGSIVMFGFPVETMTNETRRLQAMGRVLDFLGAGIDIETQVNGQDADSVTGPILVPGSSAALTYIVTNPGIVSLSGVSVVDDNGTPGNAGDDFNATFSSGDTNSNSQLDVGETWTYTATRTVVAGQTTRSGKATGTASTTTVNKSDAANYFGSVPGIAIETRVNGEDADSVPGPTLAAGGNTPFSYVLTNTGNIALASVVVTDDNGTPGNTADDFNPILSSGDTNTNNLLDLGETWTFTATRTVVAGQFSGVGSVTAQDSISQAVNSSDAVNYFGSAPAVALQTSVNGDDADSPPGPTLAAGSSATFDYVLTNTGNVAINSVVVVDDNGTPGNAGDDFNPTFTGGDSNSNNVLDLGETWTYTAVRTVISGQYTNTSSASGLDSISQVVSGSDPTNYFGSAPAITIVTRIDVAEADSPPGPTLAPGSNTMFAYYVTNTGNIALSNVVVTDNNGTPGNAADDFQPNFSGGDLNSNNLMDPDETWLYVATRTVIAGQYSSITMAAAQDIISQSVNDTDPVNYFGPVPSVSLQTSVNGDDADSPPGPTLTAGSSATFNYAVTNTGNTAVNIIVTDDNDTPGDLGDDFNPTFTGGDLNNDEHLDLGETWTYTAVRTVISGQYTNTSNADARDSLNQAFVSYDPTSYFVPANADFNSDTSVDAGDYVMWRKNSGITSGALQSQGDANGDGMVDGIDYDAWRGQYNSPDPGAGAGTSAAAGAELAAPAAEPIVVNSLVAKDIVVESASSPATATEARSMASVKDSAFEQLSAGANARRVSQRSVTAAQRIAAHEFSPEWTSLLTLLVDHKTGPDNGAATHSSAKKSTRNGESSGVGEGAFEANLALFGLRKAASAGV